MRERENSLERNRNVIREAMKISTMLVVFILSVGVFKGVYDKKQEYAGNDDYSNVYARITYGEHEKC